MRYFSKDGKKAVVTEEMYVTALIVTAIEHGLDVQYGRRIPSLCNLTLLKDGVKIVDFAFGPGTFGHAYGQTPCVEIMGLMTPREAANDTVCIIPIRRALDRIPHYNAYLNMDEVHKVHFCCRTPVDDDELSASLLREPSVCKAKMRKRSN